MVETKISKQGRDGESAFNDWLNQNNISFLYLNQDKSRFASLFSDDVKRPDFLVLIESIGLLAVDVKNYTHYKDGGYSLGLEKEIRRVITFERIFRIPVWYAYFSEKEKSNAWYWISALKAVEVGEVRGEKKKGQEEFLFLKDEHFVRIETNDDLGRLYTHRFKSYQNLKNFK